MSWRECVVTPYAVIAELARAERFDPIGDFLAGREVGCS